LATRVDLTPVRRSARVTGAAVRCGGRDKETDRAQHSTPASDPNLPVEACYLGWQESLRNLSRLVEPEITDGQQA
jgi:hypothetical protein